MPLVVTRANASARAYGFTSTTPEVLGGMVLVTPTSIASTGTGNSSSINSNGSVTFDTCATLSLNGVFTADYDNYMIVARLNGTLSGTDWRARLRASGTDSTATTDYNSQFLYADSTTVGAVRNISDGYWVWVDIDNEYTTGTTGFVYGPYLSQPTAYRTVNISSSNAAYLVNLAGTHELSSSYDGITMTTGQGAFTGLVSVYGLVGA